MKEFKHEQSATLFQRFTSDQLDEIRKHYQEIRFEIARLSAPLKNLRAEKALVEQRLSDGGEEKTFFGYWYFYPDLGIKEYVDKDGTIIQDNVPMEKSDYEKIRFDETDTESESEGD